MKTLAAVTFLILCQTQTELVPGSFQIGQKGKLNQSYTCAIKQIMPETNEVLVTSSREGRRIDKYGRSIPTQEHTGRFIVSGMDTKGYVDGDWLPSKLVYAVTGTKTVEKKTYFVLTVQK